MACAVVSDQGDCLLGDGRAVAAGGMAVLASSGGVDEEQLEAAIRHNPAGNAAERTPVLLVRSLSV